MVATTGDIFGQTCVVEYLPKTSAAINAGDLLQYTSTGFQTCPLTAKQIGPWAVALETKASSTTVIKAVRNKGAMVYVTADGAINPGSYIVNSAVATAGYVVAYSANTVTNDTVGIKTARDEAKLIVGEYLAHELEGNGDSDAAGASGVAVAPTAAAQGDVIRIMIGGL